MFKNGFIHRVKVRVSRPYAEMIEGREDYVPFFDEDEAYIESDSDFEDVVGKRILKEEEREEMDE